MASRIADRRVCVGVADASFREALQRTLSREGVRASAFGSVLPLLTALDRESWDACILDVDLSAPGALDPTTRIQERYPKLPLILVSAHLLPDQELANSPLPPVLPLPFRREQLLEILQRALGPSQT